ncbi:MAG: cytochrome c biogenesis protein ResB, partial [Verrucomicrobia bacterium]|nr:cytochrome c biogenesis protein ResB [Verrucomicrobiota bacterium]
ATSAGLSGSPVTFTATAAVLAATKLAITSVNSGANPTAGTGFSVVVQAQASNGTPVNVVANTTVTLSLATGAGTLGGTLTGAILAGNNSVAISGVTYTKAESGVVLTATRISGDALTAGNSAAFTVNAGAATMLALTSGNSQSRGKSTALASPFVVTVSDAYGNPVSGRSVTFAIATVPVGATGQSLSTTSTTTAANGQASSILTLGNLAGAYTVTATSAGLAGSPVTFTATSGNYSVVASATYEYQICFKCHSGYAWLPGGPPNGISPNGTATTPVQTDVAQEFSPMNLSGHPIVTGLDNYPNSILISGKRGLLAAAMKPPWDSNVGQQTMMVSGSVHVARPQCGQLAHRHLLRLELVRQLPQRRHHRWRTCHPSQPRGLLRLSHRHSSWRQDVTPHRGSGRRHARPLRLQQQYHHDADDQFHQEGRWQLQREQLPQQLRRSLLRQQHHHGELVKNSRHNIMETLRLSLRALKRSLRSPSVIVGEIVALALAGMLGASLPQAGTASVESLVRLHESGPLWTALVKVFALDHVFRSAWFLTLTVLATASLWIVTVEQVRRLRVAWTQRPSPAHLQSAPFRVEFERPARRMTMAPSIELWTEKRLGLA